MTCLLRCVLFLVVLLAFSNQDISPVVVDASSSRHSNLNAASPPIPTNTSDMDPAVQQAIQKCRDKLSQDPDFPKAQHMLAMLLESLPAGSHRDEIADLSFRAGSCQKKDHPHALEDTKRVDALVRAANAFQQLGQLPQAVEAHRRAILLVDTQSAMEELLRDATPHFVRYASSLGSSAAAAVADLDDTDYRAAFAVQVSEMAKALTGRFPQSLVAYQFQGALSRAWGHREAAYQAYHHAATMILSENILCDTNNPIHGDSPSLLETHIQSNILASSAAREAGRDVATQMKYLTTAQSLLDNHVKPSNVHEHEHQSETERYLRAEVYNAMGIAQKAAGNKKQAIAFFQSALETKPGDGHALAQLASLDAPSMTNIKTLDAEYVQGLFDGYSARFEEELVNTLEYQGHQWVSHQVIQALMQRGDGGGDDSASTVRPIAIVDLGCGTGLVGEFIRSQWLDHDLLQPFFPSIVGVDLSERMVAMAASRDYQNMPVYESVKQEDAVAFLQGRLKASVGAIVAADVFIYIGDLEQVLVAGAAALSSTGVFVFSVELSEQADNDVGGMLLLQSGRFGHSREYIERVARKAGFQVTVWDEGPLRKQRGAVVRGAVVVLKKSC